MPEGIPINGKEELDMSRKNKVGYSKKYASAAKSFDRSMNRLAHSVSRVAFSSKSTAKSIPKASRKSHMDEPEFETKYTSIPQPVTVVCVLIGVLVFLADFKDGGFLVSLIFGFIACGVSLLILCVIYGGIAGAKEFRSQDSDKCEGLLESVYNPNPEWMGQTGLVDSRANAKVLAPQFLKQAQESAKILQTTTEPATFFTRYDFCVGRLMELEKCKKYGAQVSTTDDLKKYRSLGFRDDAVKEIIHRTEEKYQAKIESLKTAKAKQNWAEKYYQEFEPYLPYMTDGQKSELGEASAYLFDLAQK